MKPVITKDQSMTFYSEEYGETYHSVTGAVEEAYRKFAEPSLDAAKGKDEVRILDICFGLGYNSAAAIDRILEHNPGCKINIVGLEKDKRILDQIPGISPPIRNFYLIQKAVKNNNAYDQGKIAVMILVSNALDSVGKLKENFDIIFLDPFSPKKNPELWTEEFFKELRKLIKPDGILTTYSCAGQVRRNLKAAGFAVKDGPCIGRRSPSTIATPIKTKNN